MTNPLFFRASIAGILLVATIIPEFVAAGIDMSLLQRPTYGVDCSFPIHYKELRCGSLLGDRESVYNEFMNGCRGHFKGDDCDFSETMRFTNNLLQPESIKNHTSIGFKTVMAPQVVRDTLSDFWNRNKYRMKVERWPRGATEMNFWESPTYVVSVGEKKLRGAEGQLNELQEAIKETVEEWTGNEMKSVATYGIRVNTEGSIVPPHITRSPLMTSVLVKVAEDVDESWDMEIYRRDGHAINVTLEAGEMIMYESGSLIHGNPFPLKGRYVATMYFHFEPTGRILAEPQDLEDELLQEAEIRMKLLFGIQNQTESMNNGSEDNIPGVVNIDEIEQRMINLEAPPAIEQEAATEVGSDDKQENSDTKTLSNAPEPSTEANRPEIGRVQPATSSNKEEKPLEEQQPKNYASPIDPKDRPKEQPKPRILEAHKAASVCDFEELQRIAKVDPQALFKQDENGWQPIHEAARNGHVKCLKFLVESGADVNALTEKGSGVTPLRITADFMGREGRAALAYLRSVGGHDVRPEL